MKILFKLILFLYYFSYTISFSQNIDTISRKPHLIKQSITPLVLTTFGVLINKSDFEKDVQLNLRNRVGHDYELRIDDFFQYVPVAEMIGVDILHVKSKNHWFDQSKYLLISNAFSFGITHGLKHLFLKTRPNGSPYSFPSGHTTFAFTNATVLFHEYKGTFPVIAYSGYAFAITTGTFRMLNNRHWLSDVLVGTGIGILTTDLVYYFEPLKNFNPFKQSKNLTIVPQISDGYCGLFLNYRF